jgi:hypothetical protein
MLRNSLIIGLMILSANSFAADSGTSTMSARELSAGDRYNAVGVGLQIGSYSGVNIEYWLTQFTTLNPAITFSSNNTAVSFDHRWLIRDAFSGDARALVPYVGAGAQGVWGNINTADNRNYNNENFILAAQVPFGLEFLPAAQRFGIFGEIAPALEITPNVVGLLNADIGARLYF